LNLDFCKLLPSPFGRGAGGEGIGKSHKKGKTFSVHSPHPLPVGEGTLNPQFAKLQLNINVLVMNINVLVMNINVLVSRVLCIGDRNCHKINAGQIYANVP
jgi:hypothetical protein